MSYRFVIKALGLGLLLAGCDDLREFKTGPDSVFSGEVIGSDAAQLTESFIRKGFESHTLLELRFNPDASGLPVMVDGAATDGANRSVPGTLNTYTCPEGRTRCSEDERTVGPFDRAPLLTIEALAHDTLSQYTFPGGGRLQNYIFGARYATQVGERRVMRDAMVFVSLMDTDQVEVRVMAPSVLASDGESERLPALYGVFVLNRQRL